MRALREDQERMEDRSQDYTNEKKNSKKERDNKDRDKDWKEGDTTITSRRKEEIKAV